MERLDEPATDLAATIEEGLDAAPDLELEIDETEFDDESEVETLRFDIASYPADYTVKVLVQKWRDGQLIIPEFQRAYVWNQPQASKLIESFLIGLPVPQIFLYKDRDSQKLLVIDGHQRIKSLAQFYDEQFRGTRIFRLQGVHPRWQGKKYSDLDEADKLRLDDSPLRSIVVQQLSPDDQESIYLIFERLNTGGVRLSPMEIRKSIFHGPAVELVERLNLDPNWRRLIGLATPDARLKDVELIVRVLALAHRWRDYSKPMKTFVTKYMEHLSRTTDGERARQAARFRQATQVASTGLGERPFHLRSRLNIAALDSVLGGIIESNLADPTLLTMGFAQLKQPGNWIDNVFVSTSDSAVVRTRFQAVLDCLRPTD